MKKPEGKKKKDTKKTKMVLYTDRFDNPYLDGDYITYITNTGEIKLAYVTVLEDGEYLFSKVYSESWLCPGEYLDAPGYPRGLFVSRETYSLKDLDANTSTIVCLKKLNIKEVYANYRIW